MYLPTQFNEPNVEVMHDLIQSHPLATLVTLSSSELNANHIPFYLLNTPAPLGTLQGHVSRVNPILKDFEVDKEVLAVFHGPDAYITPSWYATKQTTGKVVPTWNYAVVHIYGYMRVVDDATWLSAHLEVMTAHNEAPFATPWTFSDTPPEFAEKVIGHIVGVEMVIARMVGKWKVSQNQPQQNQVSVIEGLKSSGQQKALAMAALVESAPKTSVK